MSTPPESPKPLYRHYLKEWRERRGYYQEDLAKMVGTTPSVISRFETGERHMKFDMQIKLMEKLRITPAQFFSPPDDQPVEAMVSRAPPEVKAMLARMVRDFIPDDL